MKKFISVLLSIISVICISFTVICCGERPDQETTESDGRLYTIINAFDEEWIDKDDLKSIACGYYEWRNIEDNPYSGRYEQPIEQLSKETENKIKQAYFDRSEEVKILKYYGTYEGNVVVTLGYENVNYEAGENADVTIDGVVFPELKLYPIRVYHYFEKADPSIKITGRLFGIKPAYENGLIDENDLNSIACSVNEGDSCIENLYNGKLSKDTKNELKQAYLTQIYDESGDLLDGIKIHKYYGTYSGHMVVSMTGDRCSIGATTEGTEIDGVAFNNSDWRSIYVYYQYR